MIRATLNQIQILAILFGGIDWSPDVPPIFWNPLSFVFDFLSLDISGMLTSPECTMSLTIFKKWQLSMFIPAMLTGLFFVWYFVTGIYHVNSDNDTRFVVKVAIQMSFVEVFFIGIYISVMKTSFQIFNCSKYGTLVMDPETKCDIMYNNMVITGGFVFFYGLFPYGILTYGLIQEQAKKNIRNRLKEPW
jgi:hypothetical protein